MSTIASAAITAQNTFTPKAKLEGNFSISISGTFVATVVVQRSPDGTNWFDVNSFTAPFEGTGYEPEEMFYRIGVKTSGFGSGTVNVRLGVSRF
jgi:hypothetical protein